MLSKPRHEIYGHLESMVGNTPLFEIKNIATPNSNRIFAKEEWRNPTGSIWDRVYPFLFKSLEEQGVIIPGITPVIETTAGNAGASCAWVARELGYECTIIIPEDAPQARIRQIKSLGAAVVLSPKGLYAKGNIQVLNEILRRDKASKGGKLGENPKLLYCINKIDPKHRVVTYAVLRKLVQELAPALDGIGLNYFVVGVGSGATISGIGKAPKEYWPNVKIIGIDPVEAPVVYYFKYKDQVFDSEFMPHDIHGIGVFGVPPELLSIDLDIIDEVMWAGKTDWQYGCSSLYRYEDRQLGRSTGAALSCILKLAEKVERKNFLMIFHDPSWKYENHFR